MSYCGYDKTEPKCYKCDENLQIHSITEDYIITEHIYCSECEREINILDKPYLCRNCNFNYCKYCMPSKDYYKCTTCCCELFTNHKIFCNFSGYNISYYFLFCISIIFGLIMHLSDISTDIYVLLDLYNKQLEYFYICGFIICLSFFGSFINTLIFLSNQNTNVNKSFQYNFNHYNNYCKFSEILYRFLIGALQLGIFIEVYISMTKGGKTMSFTWSRVIEGLVESSAQTLFQLYLTILNSTVENFQSQIYYYLSIVVSILSFTFGLYSFEFYNYTYNSVIRDRVIIKGVNKLSYFSRFAVTLFFFRLSEIISRMFILCSFGYFTKNGYNIIYILFLDWILSTFINVCAVLKNFASSINPTNFIEIIQVIFMMIFYFIVMFISLGILQILFLPVFWIPITSTVLADSPILVYNYKHHWVLKALQHLFMSGIIYYNIYWTDDFKDDHSIAFSITIIANICFIIKYITFAIILHYNKCNKNLNSLLNYNYEKYEDDENYIKFFKSIF